MNLCNELQPWTCQEKVECSTFKSQGMIKWVVVLNCLEYSFIICFHFILKTYNGSQRVPRCTYMAPYKDELTSMTT